MMSIQCRRQLLAAGLAGGALWRPGAEHELHLVQRRRRGRKLLADCHGDRHEVVLMGDRALRIDHGPHMVWSDPPDRAVLT